MKFASEYEKNKNIFLLVELSKLYTVFTSTYPDFHRTMRVRILVEHSVLFLDFSHNFL